MDNNDPVISIIIIALSSISLIVTIIGWTATAKRQKELLEKQIEADREKTNLQIAAEMRRDRLEYSRPRHIERIDTLRKWIIEGKTIYKEAVQNEPKESGKNDAVRKINAWKDNFVLNMFQTTYLLEQFDMSKPNELLALCVQYSEMLSHTTILEVRKDFFSELTPSASLVNHCQQLETKILGKLGELEYKILQI